MPNLENEGYANLDERITEAGVWLDENYEGWQNWVDEVTLDMELWNMCIGGQMGVPWETLRTQYAKDTGNAPDGVFSAGRERWVQLILDRR